jgi:hypothetical protein
MMKTAAETVAGNVRVYRQLRRLEQGVVARRLQSLGIPWRQVTVSEVERNQRNVTITELLGLAVALETTIEQLLDPRGPERMRGPYLVLEDPELQTLKAGPPLVIMAEDLTALVCTHKAHAVAAWDDDFGLQGLRFEHEDQH